jgi:hypothetical protein
MRAIDIKNLRHFRTHMGMYIPHVNRQVIIAFIHGYQSGAGKACRFTEAHTEHLSRHYGIKVSPLGWPHQIERLAKRLSQSWIKAFLMISAEILEPENPPKSLLNGGGRGRKQ